MVSDEDLERRAWFRREIAPLEPQLRQYLRRIAPRDLDIDDLVHDALVKAMSMAGWRDVASPRGFLKTVARNLVYDILRRRRIVPLDNFAELDAADFVDNVADAEAVLAGRQELRELARLVCALPPQCRKVFTLRKVYGLLPGEIAEQLGLSVSTVEKHLVKALRICSEGLARRPYVAGGGDHARERQVRAGRGQPKGR